MVSNRHVPQIQNSSEDYFNFMIEIPIREVSIIDVHLSKVISILYESTVMNNLFIFSYVYNL